MGRGRRNHNPIMPSATFGGYFLFPTESGFPAPTASEYPIRNILYVRPAANCAVQNLSDIGLYISSGKCHVPSIYFYVLTPLITEGSIRTPV